MLSSVGCTAEQLSQTYTCIHSLQTPLPTRLPSNIEQSSCFGRSVCGVCGLPR